MLRSDVDPRGGRGVVRLLLRPALGVLAALLLASPAAADPQPAAPVPLDSSGLVSTPSGLQLSIARDGSGGLVYLRHDPGSSVQHVFLSRLSGGTFAAPVAIDGGLGGSSSQPVVAAASGGTLLVAFVNDSTLYTVTIPSAAAPLPAPAPLAAGGFNPALSLNHLGKAYLAFVVPDGSGDDVRTAFYDRQAWHLDVGALNASPGDAAGTGSGRPAVATAGDGVAIVAWGEAGHVLSRRVTGTSPSTALEQADGTLAGCTEQAADEPAIGTGGDSSYAIVAFRETVSCAGAAAVPRVLLRRLVASQYDPPQVADGGGAADEPRVAVSEYGRGFVTAVQSDSHDTILTRLSTNEAPGTPQTLNGEPDAADPVATPALAGFSSEFIAWQQAPGAGGGADVRLRFAQNGGALGAETVLSQASGGPTDAIDGLAAAGDVQGNAAVAWLQGDPAAPLLYVEQLYQPPGGFSAVAGFAYVRTRQPVLSWRAAAEQWGPVTYALTVDGQPAGQTTGTSLPVPTPLADGPHRWQVTATNPAGATSTMAAATVWVDAVAPSVSLSLSGRRQVGSYLHIRVSATDAPRGETGASGIARITLDLGDGSAYVVQSGKYHAWRHPGTYRITALVEDRAGNLSVASTTVRIAPRPAPHRRAPHRPPARRRR